MDEQEVLAVVRTLLAYERNYLSIERTQLAQLRTGLTLALITPPAAATLAYAFEFPSERLLHQYCRLRFLNIDHSIRRLDVPYCVLWVKENQKNSKQNTRTTT